MTTQIAPPAAGEVLESANAGDRHWLPSGLLDEPLLRVALLLVVVAAVVFAQAPHPRTRTVAAPPTSVVAASGTDSTQPALPVPSERSARRAYTRYWAQVVDLPVEVLMTHFGVSPDPRHQRLPHTHAR